MLPLVKSYTMWYKLDATIPTAFEAHGTTAFIHASRALISVTNLKLD